MRPNDGSADDNRVVGRDKIRYGPLERGWAHWKGLYSSGDQVVFSYTVGDTEVLEVPGAYGDGLRSITRSVCVTQLSLSIFSSGCGKKTPPGKTEFRFSFWGGFLEGLDLPDFHDFYTWCIGQREHATRSQARLYQTLLERLAENPAKCLPHATHLVTLLPYDEEARASRQKQS